MEKNRKRERAADCRVAVNESFSVDVSHVIVLQQQWIHSSDTDKHVYSVYFFFHLIFPGAYQGFVN